MTRPRGAWLPIAIGLLIVAWGLRVNRIIDHDIWWDEGASVYVARLPFLDGLRWTAGDVHPPLYFVLLKGWRRPVGDTPYALRIGSALLGMVGLALATGLARRYAGHGVALVALLLLTPHRLQIEMAQEVRMYTLGIALTTLSVWLFLRLVADGDWRIRWWVGNAAVSLAGLYTFYFFGITILIQTAIVGAVLATRPRTSLYRLNLARGWLAHLAIVAAGFAPWAFYFLSQPRNRPFDNPPIDLVSWLRATITSLAFGISAYLDNWVIATVVAIAAPTLVLVARRASVATITLLSLIAAPPLLMYLMTMPNPFLYSPNLFVRYVAPYTPAYAIVIAGSLAFLARWWRPVGIAATIVWLAIASIATWDLYYSRWQRDNYETVASYLGSYQRDGDAIILYSDWDWPVFLFRAGFRLPRYGTGSLDHLTREKALRLAEGWMDRHDSVWLLERDNAYDTDPEHFLRIHLDQTTRIAADITVGNKRLTLYTRDPARTIAVPAHKDFRPTDLRSNLGPSPALVGHDLWVREVDAGQTVHIATFWRGTGAPGDESILSLVGANGRAYARDTLAMRPDWSSALWPSDQTVRVDQNLLTRADLPPGDYSVRLGRAREGQFLGEVPLATLLVRGEPPSPRGAGRRLSSATLFGGAIGLEPSVVPDTITRGVPLDIRLTWVAEQASGRRLKTFVQLIGSIENAATGNRVWRQVDAEPFPALPTNRWLPGEVHVMSSSLETERLPIGRYELIVGLYDVATGRREQTGDGVDRVVLSVYEVR